MAESAVESERKVDAKKLSTHSSDGSNASTSDSEGNASSLNEILMEISDEECKQFDEPDPQPQEEMIKLAKIVFPVMGTSVLEFLPGFVSVLLAGNMDSPHAQHFVDAAAISNMLLNVSALAVGMGLASALDTLCSQAYGAKRFDKIGVYFQTGMIVLLVVLVPILVLNASAEQILNFLGQNQEVTRLSKDFSRLMLPGLPFLFLYELVRKVLSTQNVLKPLVVIAIVGNIVNAVVGYGLAYHTSLGLNGLAVARSVANVTLALLLVPYFWWNPSKLTQWWSGWNLKAAVEHVGLFLSIGVPGMLMMSVEIWAFEILAVLAGLLPNSVTALSTHAVLANVIAIMYMMMFGLSAAASIRVGNCLGANSPKAARMACHAALFMVFLLTLMFATLLHIFSDQIPRMFLRDQDSVNLAGSIFSFWGLFQVVDGFNTVLQGVYRGAGKQKSALFAILVCYYGIGMSLGTVLAFKFALGVKGLWLGIGSGIVSTTLALLSMMLTTWQWGQLAAEARRRTAQ